MSLSEPYSVRSIRDMSNQELDEHVQLIRERRMRLRRAWEFEQRQKLERELGKQLGKLDKLYEKLPVQLDQLDRKMDKIERDLIAVQALRIQITAYEEIGIVPSGTPDTSDQANDNDEEGQQDEGQGDSHTVE